MLNGQCRLLAAERAPTRLKALHYEIARISLVGNEAAGLWPVLVAPRTVRSRSHHFRSTLPNFGDTLCGRSELFEQSRCHFQIRGRKSFGKSQTAVTQHFSGRVPCEIAGQIEEASRLVDEALQIVERTGERWFAAELYRHKGRLLLRQGYAQAAEKLHRKTADNEHQQTVGIARRRNLARLWQGQGRRRNGVHR